MTLVIHLSFHAETLNIKQNLGRISLEESLMTIHMCRYFVESATAVVQKNGCQDHLPVRSSKLQKFSGSRQMNPIVGSVC